MEKNQDAHRRGRLRVAMEELGRPWHLAAGGQWSFSVLDGIMKLWMAGRWGSHPVGDSVRTMQVHDSDVANGNGPH